MLLDFIETEADRLGQAALAKVDPSSWSTGRKEVRGRLYRSLGLDPLPPRSPLHDRLVGVVEGDGYRIERLVFEPRPGFVAPALLYLPTDHDGPLPAVVFAVGHWMSHGKSETHAQATCIGLARLGFVALAVDPIGQGERGPSFESHGIPALLPLGLSQEGLRVWELIRAIDYLRSRPEVDGDRLGITGASGGGLATVFTAAADERIGVAVPVCFVTSYARFLRVMRGLDWNGVDDLCNQVPGIISYAEMAGLCGSIYPRPLLIINGLRDPQFPVAGAQEVIDHVRPLYDQGDASALRLHVVDADHGYDQSMREAAYGWFLKWLKGVGDGSPVPEPAMRVLPAGSPALKCFRQPAPISSTQAVLDLVLESASRRGLGPNSVSVDPTGADEIREVLGIESMVHGTGQLADTTDVDGLNVERHLIVPEPGITVPAHLFEPHGGAAAFVLYLADEGKTSEGFRPLIGPLLEVGGGLFAMEPRGTGETSPVPPTEMTIATLDGTLEATTPSEDEHLEFEVATDCLMLGRSLLGQQVQDVIAATEYLGSIRPHTREGIRLVARGTLSALRAAFAAALEPRITALWLDGWPLSYASLALATPGGLPITAYIFDVLRHFDLADVLALLAERTVRISHPVDGRGVPIDAAAFRIAYAATIERFAEAGGSFEVLDADAADLGPGAWR